MQLRAALLQAARVRRVHHVHQAVHVRKVLRPHAADARAAAQVVERNVAAVQALDDGRGEAHGGHHERVHVCAGAGGVGVRAWA